jgi:hypothetical protein
LEHTKALQFIYTRLKTPAKMRRRMSINKDGTSRVEMCEDLGNSDRNNMIIQNCRSFVCPLSLKTELVDYRLILVCRKFCCWWKGSSKWIVIVY